MAGSNSSFSGFGDLFAGIFGKSAAQHNLPQKPTLNSWASTESNPALRPDVNKVDPNNFGMEGEYDVQSDYYAGTDIRVGDQQRINAEFLQKTPDGRIIVNPAFKLDANGKPVVERRDDPTKVQNRNRELGIVKQYENRVINPQVQQQLLDASMGKAPGQDLLSAAARGDTDSQRLLSDAAHGKTPSQAELMLQREGGRIANQAMSQARSAREYNPALERAAVDSGVTARADAANQAAIMRAGEMANARGAYDASMSAGRGAYDTSLAGGRANAASYTLGQQGANDQMTSLMRNQDFQSRALNQQGGMALNQAEQNAVNSKNAARLGVAASLQGDRSAENTYDLARAGLVSGYAAQTGKGLGGIADSGMDFMERMFSTGGGSDERMKKDIKPLPSQDVNDMLDNLVPSTYKYKNPDMPWTRPGQQAGVMAQDLEKSPMGASMVRDTPVGKIVDTNAAIGALLAANADLHKRLKKVEGQDVEIGRAEMDKKPRYEVSIGPAKIDPYQIDIGQAEINPNFVTPEGGTIVRNIGPAFQYGASPEGKGRRNELFRAGTHRSKYGV